MSKHFLEILEKSKAIHVKKSQDYTTNPTANPHENFERANIIASWFPDEYKSFAVLIGTKLARLAALLSSGRAPNNESIDDTFLDQLTYTGLMYAFYKDKVKDLPSGSFGPLGEPEYIRGLASLNPTDQAKLIGCDGHAEEFHIECGACRHKNRHIYFVSYAPGKWEMRDSFCWHNKLTSAGICVDCKQVLQHKVISRNYQKDTYENYIRKV